MKINFKVFLGFLSASVVLILTLSIVFYNDLFNILTNQYLSEKKQEISLREEAINENLSELESEITYASNLTSLYEYANASDQKSKEAEKLTLSKDLHNFIKNHHMYSQVSYTDETGQEIVKLRINPEKNIVEIIPEDQLQNIKDTYYFEETTKLDNGKIFASLINSDTSNEKSGMSNEDSNIPYHTTEEESENFTVNYSIPVIDQNNQRKGIITGSVFSNLIFKEIKENAVKKSSTKAITNQTAQDEKLYIVDNNGYYIEHPDKTKEWGFLFNKNEKIQNDLLPEIERIFVESSGQFFDKKTGLFITFNRLPLSGNNVEKIHMGSHAHNIEEAKSYTKINDTKNYWVIIITLNESSILNRVNVLFYKTLSLLFLVLLLFIVSMMWFFRIVVVDPLEKLRQGAQRIKRGNLDYQFDVGNRKDEIGELANEFNSMAAVLKGYKETMEDQVAKRTADLEKFKLAVENAFDYVIITDTKGIILYVNKAIERITGFTRREVMGKKIGSKELWGGLMSKDFYDNMWQTISVDKKGFLGEVKNRKKNGENYNALLSITPILNKNHEIEFFISIERDITNVAKESY